MFLHEYRDSHKFRDGAWTTEAKKNKIRKWTKMQFPLKFQVVCWWFPGAG